METIEIRVETRSAVGKAAARFIRRQGALPATLYGSKRPPLSVQVDTKDFEMRVGNLEGAHLLRLESPSPNINGCLALVKDLQRHPVSRELLHADLFEVDVKVKLRIRVPLHFVGRSQGVELGGVLQPIRRDIDVLCLPLEIPDFIEIDVTELGLHDAIHASQIVAQEGVEVVYDSDFAVVTVLPPVVEEVKIAAVEGAEGSPVEGGTATESSKSEPGKATP
jgi:large subunit ribosomal protein L25